jgi:hypothetical protein
MLFRETVAVYCENHMEHTNIYKHSVRTSQETYYVSAREPNLLILFGETVAVYCENHTEHTDTLCEQNAEFYCIKAGGTYSNHWVLQGYSLHFQIADGQTEDSELNGSNVILASS